MGTYGSRERSCTVQYPADTQLILELTDVMSSPVVLFLIAVGTYHTGRYLACVLIPESSRLISALWQRISIRVHRRPVQYPPTIRDPPRERPRTPRQRPSPRTRPSDAPGSLAILTPAKDPPVALVAALNDYQNRAISDQRVARAPVPANQRPTNARARSGDR